MSEFSEVAKNSIVSNIEDIKQSVIQQIKHCLFRHIKTGLL